MAFYINTYSSEVARFCASKDNIEKHFFVFMKKYEVGLLQTVTLKIEVKSPEQVSTITFSSKKEDIVVAYPITMPLPQNSLEFSNLVFELADSKRNDINLYTDLINIMFGKKSGIIKLKNNSFTIK